MKARDVMSSPVIFLRPRVPADVAAALLVAHGYTAAPVVDDDGLVVGSRPRRTWCVAGSSRTAGPRTSGRSRRWRT
ncbi:CBS domain-containing protein [Pseudonocardia cypriaca]|uniref:CBS domain-containing protein n=1 Tax=Pseudonocardia cypriaca TaxID=882449 RepID=UPI001154BDA6